MTHYLDTSVLVSLFHQDIHTERATTWIAGVSDFVLSTWALAEFTSALAVQARMKRLADGDRSGLEIRLDRWIPTRVVLPVIDGDMIQARQLVRADTRLRAADALHLAVAARHGCTLATLDKDMADVAQAVGLRVDGP